MYKKEFYLMSIIRNVFLDCEDFFPDISIVPAVISFNDINAWLKKEIDFFEAKWKELHRSSLPKRVGDLQWRILHGTIAVNSFVAMLNPNVREHCCPFCNLFYVL